MLEKKSKDLQSGLEVKVCGSMEDTTILLILVIAWGMLLTGIKLYKANEGKNKPKTRKDTAIDTLDKVNDATIERLSKELKKESGRANRLQALKEQYEGSEEEPEENEQKQVTFEEITTLVKQSYPKYLGLLPLMKKQIMEATKGMSLDEVLDYVKQFTGNKESSTGDPASITNAEFNPNFA